MFFLFWTENKQKNKYNNNNKKNCVKLLSCFAGISKVMCPCFLSL